MRWRVIKSWKDAGPTVSPSFRMWSGCIESDHICDDHKEWDQHDLEVRSALEGAGFTVVASEEDPVCYHGIIDEDDFADHVSWGCEQARVAVYVHVPAVSADSAYRQACAALDVAVSA